MRRCLLCISNGAALDERMEIHLTYACDLRDWWQITNTHANLAHRCAGVPASDFRNSSPITPRSSECTLLDRLYSQLPPVVFLTPNGLLSATLSSTSPSTQQQHLTQMTARTLSSTSPAVWQSLTQRAVKASARISA